MLAEINWSSESFITKELPSLWVLGRGDSKENSVKLIKLSEVRPMTNDCHWGTQLTEKNVKDLWWAHLKEKAKSSLTTGLVYRKLERSRYHSEIPLHLSLFPGRNCEETVISPKWFFCSFGLRSQEKITTVRQRKPLETMDYTISLSGQKSGFVTYYLTKTICKTNKNHEKSSRDAIHMPLKICKLTNSFVLKIQIGVKKIMRLTSISIYKREEHRVLDFLHVENLQFYFKSKYPY